MYRLHPGARWFFRSRIYYYSILIGAPLLTTLLFIMITSKIPQVFAEGSTENIFSTIRRFAFIVLPSYAALTILIAEIYGRMAYNRFFYEIGENSIEIIKGVIWKKHVSIPYDRVQNIDVKRGLLARIFDFSSIEIETAGNSPYKSYLTLILKSRIYESEGNIPAVNVETAERIKEFVLRKIRKSRNYEI